MFVCATVSIVSGAVAERIKIWPFFIFSAIMAAFIYPISMGWQWGGGWLATAGFSDFAGSTLVHACLELTLNPHLKLKSIFHPLDVCSINSKFVEQS